MSNPVILKGQPDTIGNRIILHSELPNNIKDFQGKKCSIVITRIIVNLTKKVNGIASLFLYKSDASDNNPCETLCDVNIKE